MRQPVKKFTTLLTGLFGLWLTAPAQTVPYRNQLELQYGIRHVARQDHLFSPMIYRGTAPLNLTLSYQRQGTASRHGGTIGFGQYNAASGSAYQYKAWRTQEALTSEPTSFLLLDLHYFYLRRMAARDRMMDLYAGATLDNQAGALFYGYGHQAFFGYTLFTSLSPTIEADFALSEKQRLGFRFRFPLLSWLSRSPYAVNDDQFIDDQSSHRTLPMLANFYRGGELVSMNRFQRLNADIRYERMMGRRFSMSATYRIEFMRYTRPLKVTSYRNDLLLGATYHF